MLLYRVQMNLEELRDNVRAYLRNHWKGQAVIAKELEVSPSWLNKFINGAFDNLRVKRLQRLVDWVEQDRRANAGAQLNRMVEATN